MANVRNVKRRRRILEATVEIVGREGIGAVTHRAIAAEAGVPLAATTYYFASKETLLEEAFTMSIQIDLDELEILARSMMQSPPSVEVFVQSITRFIVGQLRSRRASVIAQFQLTLEAARRPALQAASRASAEAYLRVFKIMLAELGSANPVGDAHILIAALDGLCLDQLAVPRSRLNVAALTRQVRRLVEALLLPQPERSGKQLDNPP